MDELLPDGSVIEHEPTTEDFKAMRAQFFKCVNELPRDNGKCMVLLDMMICAVAERCGWKSL